MKIATLLVLSAKLSIAAVVSDTNITLQTNTSGGLSFTTDYVLSIEQYPPPGGSETSVFFDHDGESLTFRTMNVDGGSYWYFTQFNDPFTAESVASGQFVLFNQFDQSFSVPYGDFYLGVRTFSDFGESIYGFGWAQLRNTATGLELLGSAITYDQPGILVGTLTTIPEPGTMALVALSTLPLLRRRRSSL